MSNSNDNNGFFDQPTRVVGSSDTRPRSSNDDLASQPTRVVGGQQTPAVHPPSNARASAATINADATRVYQPSSQEPSHGSAATTASGPVVGWIVVIKGPGKGQSLPLGYGWNSIGRGEDQAVPLNFGDSEISRTNHCSIAYDPKNRRYFIQHGGGRNMTYLGTSPLLSPTELTEQTDVVLGNTTLRFVPFCGTHFDWQDLDA